MPALLPRPRMLLAAAAAGVLLTGCQDAPPPRGDAEDAVAFSENLVTQVLSGDQSACDLFTTAGRADFVADMTPARDCVEAVDILGAATGEHLEEFTVNHEFSMESQSVSTVVVRADFGTYADLMDVVWTEQGWRAGPTERTTSSQPPSEVVPFEGEAGDSEGHDHAH